MSSADLNPNYKGFDDWQLALREKEQKEKEVQRMNFKQQYLCGKCDFTYIDGCVELWHTRAEKDLDLTEYLGLTKEEYPDKYYCVSAGCRKEKHYLHSYEEVMAAYKDDIMMTTELPEVLASAMGDRLYLARFAEKEAMDAFISYVFATA